MTNKLVTAAVAAITVGVFASAAMAQGGAKLSSENYIPGAGADTPLSSYDAAMQGPKVSSGSRIAPSQPEAVASAQPATGAEHWVYEQGYDPHGKWHWHWVLVP